ncbi:hypothetical protein HMPREF3186_00915 [Gemella haemolysans]|uniref:Uncharacterized protein n=1 Tax=Gemella haemolysans TaxID=1379 RepID=A0A133ZXA1_9BACL|nr:hypothetical protein HMPREF3186_00915 [Gemella haemolysans]
MRRNRIKIIAHKVLQIIVETNLFLTTRVDIGISALKKYIKKITIFKLVIAPKIWTNLGGYYPLTR